MRERDTINHLPEEFGFRSEESETFPEMVVCGICFFCNAKCIHCPNAKTDFTASLKGKDRLMSWDVFKRIADECARYPHNLVRMSSAGEVLLHPEAVDMIEYLLSVKKDKNVALTTNGSRLNAETSERLLEAGIRSIEVSVDAATAEVYEKIRVGLSFDRMLKNVRELVRLRNAGGYRTRIMVSVIEQDTNRDSLEDIQAFWNDTVDVVLTRKLLGFMGLIERDKSAQKTYMSAKTPCPFLWERILIDAQGNVRGCVNDLYNTLRIGNVNEKSISELWHCDQLELWRKLHLEGRRKDVPYCKDCTDLEYRSWNYNYFHALEKQL